MATNSGCTIIVDFAVLCKKKNSAYRIKRSGKGQENALGSRNVGYHLFNLHLKSDMHNLHFPKQYVAGHTLDFVFSAGWEQRDLKVGDQPLVMVRSLSAKL